MQRERIVRHENAMKIKATAFEPGVRDIPLMADYRGNTISYRLLLLFGI